MTVLLTFIVFVSTVVNPDLSRQPKDLNTSGWAVTSTLGERNSLEDAIGVITLNKKTYSRATKLQFFNEDGTLWYEYSFYDDDPNHNLDRAKGGFEPFSFHQDYFLLALKCVGEDASRYLVVVNETTRLKKYVRKHDAGFQFQTWQQHILDLFAVGFDRSNNPLRMSPTESVQAIRLLSTDVIFHPRQIKGDWLKVSWNISDKKVRYGWVKWRGNGKLLVELFYFA